MSGPIRLVDGSETECAIAGAAREELERILATKPECIMFGFSNADGDISSSCVPLIGVARVGMIYKLHRDLVDE